MDWFFDHLQIVIFIVVGIVYVLRTLGQQREADTDREPTSPVSTDDDSAGVERTRRIQEEIRRRILARQRGEPVPGQGQMSKPASARPPSLPTVQRPSAAPTISQIDESVLERQRELQAKLAAVRAAQAKSAHLVQGIAGSIPATARPAHTSFRAKALRRDLVSTEAVRRAIILREVLGPPLALQ